MPTVLAAATKYANKSSSSSSTATTNKLRAGQCVPGLSMSPFDMEGLNLPFRDITEDQCRVKCELYAPECKAYVFFKAVSAMGSRDVALSLY
jgi:hypothetical protein